MPSIKHFILAALVAPFIPAAASAVPATSGAGLAIEARDDASIPSACATRGTGATTKWAVFSANNLMPSAQGQGEWGGGFIDNLRGVHCNPKDWQAIPDKSGKSLGMVFYTSVKCSGRDIATALHAASGVWVICDDDLNQVYANAAALGKSVVSMLAEFIPM